MQPETLLDYGFLFLLCALEITAYAWLLRPLEKRREAPWPSALLSLLAVAALFVWSVWSMTQNGTRDVYSYIYTGEYYLTLTLWIYAVYRLSVQEALYYMLLIFMSTRAVRHIIGHLLIVADGCNYLVEGSIWLYRLLSCLATFGIYMLIFTALGRILFKEKEREGSWLHLLLLASAAVPVLYSGAFAESLGQSDNWSKGLDAIFVEGVASVCGLLCVLGYEWMLEARKRESDLTHMEQILRL